MLGNAKILRFDTLLDILPQGPQALDRVQVLRAVQQCACLVQVPTFLSLTMYDSSKYLVFFIYVLLIGDRTMSGIILLCHRYCSLNLIASTTHPFSGKLGSQKRGVIPER